MSPRQSHARIQGAITGRATTTRPIETHERNVMAITRRIHTLAQKRTQLRKQLAQVSQEITFKRRELRMVLQRDSTITDTTADDRLSPGGAADAIDASEHRREHRH